MNDENKNEPQDKAVDAEVAREMEGVPEHLRDDGDAGEGDGPETPVDDALAKLDQISIEDLCGRARDSGIEGACKQIEVDFAI